MHQPHDQSVYPHRFLDYLTPRPIPPLILLKELIHPNLDAPMYSYALRRRMASKPKAQEKYRSALELEVEVGGKGKRKILTYINFVVLPRSTREHLEDPPQPALL